MIKCHTSSAAIGIYSANEVSIIINSVSLLYSAVSCSLYVVRAFLVAQLVKSPPAMRETWVQSWVGKIPWRTVRLPLQNIGLENSKGVAKSRTWLSDITHFFFFCFMYCFSWSCFCFLKISRNSILSIKGGRGWVENIYFRNWMY